jgi:hypothetical protein
MNKEILATSLMLVFAGYRERPTLLPLKSPTRSFAQRFIFRTRKTAFTRATRFDWSGVIFSLQYKGHEFYGPWFYEDRSEYARLCVRRQRHHRGALQRDHRAGG